MRFNRHLKYRPSSPTGVNRRAHIRFACQTAGLLLALAVLASAAFAQLPGDPAPGGKPLDSGSVLVYNYYSSDFPFSSENTLIELTNNHKSANAVVRLFFIDGRTCASAYATACFGPDETIRFPVSDIDPGIKGYILAFAIDINGLPNNFNFLSGRAEISLASGLRADFDAVAIEAVASVPAPPPDINSATTVSFDDIHYARVPRALELDPVYSVAGGASTILVVNRLGGSLLTGVSVSAIGAFQGILTNHNTGNQYSFSGSAGCRINQSLSDSFPLTSPVFSLALPAKQDGNLKLWATADCGLSGAALKHNPDKTATKFNSGDNLRAVTVTTANIVVPVDPAGC